MQWLYYAAAKINADQVGIPKIEANDDTVKAILEQVYIWGGIVAVLVIVIAGVFYTISQGDAEKIKRAKNTILYAVIGLVVIAMAFTLTQFVLFRVQ